MAEQARLAYEATVWAALTDVEDALVQMRGDRARLAQLRIAAEAAANAALLAQNRVAPEVIRAPADGVVASARAVAGHRA